MGRVSTVLQWPLPAAPYTVGGTEFKPGTSEAFCLSHESSGLGICTFAHSKKISDLLKKIRFFVCFFHCFSPFYAQEQITPIALCSSLFTKEPAWAICSFSRANRSFAFSLTKKRAIIARKTKEWIPTLWIISSKFEPPVQRAFPHPVFFHHASLLYLGHWTMG